MLLVATTAIRAEQELLTAEEIHSIILCLVRVWPHHKKFTSELSWLLASLPPGSNQSLQAPMTLFSQVYQP